MKTVIYPRVDRKLKEKRQAALTAFKATGSVTKAARMLGVSRQMLYLLVPGGFHSGEK